MDVKILQGVSGRVSTDEGSSETEVAGIVTSGQIDDGAANASESSWTCVSALI